MIDGQAAVSTRITPSSLYSGERVGERGERGATTRSDRSRRRRGSCRFLTPRAPNPSPLPFHPPLRGDLRSTGKREQCNHTRAPQKARPLLRVENANAFRVSCSAPSTNGARIAVYSAVAS